MFGFSLGEIIVISVVVLLVLGPERIPTVARNLGRLFAELRRATDEVRREFNFSEFTRNELKSQLKLPSQIGLRTESLVLDAHAEEKKEDHHTEVVSEPLVEPEPKRHDSEPSES